MKFAVLALFALAIVLAACGGDGSSTPTPTVSQSPTASPSPEPTPSPTEEPPVLPPLTPFGPELAAKIHAIRDRVAQIRGLPVPELKQEGVATPEDVLQTNLDSVEDISDEDRADTDAGVLSLKMLKLVPEDYSLEAFTEDYSSNIAGFYSIAGDALVVIGEPDATISLYDEMVLAHEYTHAIQDSAFDLDALREEYAEHPDDEAGNTSYGETLSCLIEGDAMVTEYQYMNEVHGPNWFNLIEYPSGVGDAGGFPEFLARDFAFNYNECYYFVEELYAEGGWEAINAAFTDPPGTTEQVLHPEKFAANELANGNMPDDLTKDLLPNWTAVDLGQFGEYDIFNYVLTLTGDYASAYDAGDGWGSGWLRVYTDGDKAGITQLGLSFDTSGDLSEFLDAFGRVLRGYDVDPDSLPGSGPKRFTIPGTPQYFAAIGQPNGEGVFELLIATDEAALLTADGKLR